MSVRAVFLDEDDARAVAARLRSDGFSAAVARERLAGEDDDEDHPWAVLSDAPEIVVELLVEQHDGWIDAADPADGAVRPAATPPPPLPSGPLTRRPQRGRAPGTQPPRVAGMDRRLMLVHAHPDDESINNGATMARYVAEGRGVTLVTCTLGEEGEVLVPDLAHLAADQEDGLGSHRVSELAAAMQALGVTDHRFLGGVGHYRDSGMAWDEAGHAKPLDTVREDTFWRADLTEASTLLAEVIREVRPQVLVTYDEFGNYGHPDHIQAHRVATYGVALAAVASYRPDLGEPWDVAKVYWTSMSLGRMRREREALKERGIDNPFERFDLDNPPRFMVADDLLSAEIDGSDYADAKVAAMRAHATQIEVDGPFFALSNHIGNQVWGHEYYRLAKGVPGPVDERGWEVDLFAGL